MLYRKLGNTGAEVSALGFGCMRLPTLDDNPGHIDEDQAANMLDYALANGVNYIDTAWTYHRDAELPYEAQGNSEKFLGRYLKNKRDDVVLATKNPVFFLKAAGDLERYLDAQLKALQTDHIDAYLLHSLDAALWDKSVGFGALELLDQAKKDGRIKYAGFSFHDEYPAFERIVAAYDWDFCLVQHNYIDVDYQAGAKGLALAAGKNMGVAIMEPLKGGRLAQPFPDEVGDVAYQGSPASLGLRFVLNNPNVSVTLSGMSSMEAVRDNINTASSISPGQLTPDEHRLIEKIRKIYAEKNVAGCTACGYCMPCPAGVDIPTCIGALNDLAIGINFWSVKEVYDQMNASKRAEHCVECGACLEKCPQHLEIPSLLAAVSDKFPK